MTENDVLLGGKDKVSAADCCMEGAAATAAATLEPIESTELPVEARRSCELEGEEESVLPGSFVCSAMDAAADADADADATEVDADAEDVREATSTGSTRSSDMGTMLAERESEKGCRLLIR